MRWKQNMKKGRRSGGLSFKRPFTGAFDLSSFTHGITNAAIGLSNLCLTPITDGQQGDNAASYFNRRQI